MKIDGISKTNMINFYKNNSNKSAIKNNKIKEGDRIEISDMAKSIRDYSIDKGDYDNSDKINRIKNELANGTYNVSGELVAKSILDSIKGSKSK